MRACALLVVLTLLVGVVPASGASTDAKLHRAQGELGDLVSQIAEQAAAIDDLRGRVAAADHRIDVAERALGLVLASRIAVRDDLEAAQAATPMPSRDYDTVVNAFMNSPGGLAQADVLGAFLEASSMGDLQDRLALGDAIVADRERAVSGLAAAKARLDVRARELDGALAAQQATVQELRAAQEEQANALASEQAALAQLSEMRDRIVSLIARLKQRLHAEDVAAVARAFQGADHVSYGQWADMVLHIFDAPTCREPGRRGRVAGPGVHPSRLEPTRDDAPDAGLDGLQRGRGAELRLPGTGPRGHQGDDPERVGRVRVRRDRRVAPSMRRRVDHGVADRGIQLVPRVPGRELRRGGRAEGRIRLRDLCLAVSRVVSWRDETTIFDLEAEGAQQGVQSTLVGRAQDRQQR